jgi:hypothetical protein
MTLRPEGMVIVVKLVVALNSLLSFLKKCPSSNKFFSTKILILLIGFCDSKRTSR